MSGPECVFCAIAAGDVPAERVVETEHAIAFRDLEPQAPVHLLVVPRRHIESAAAIGPGDAAVLADMFVAAQQAVELEDVAESGHRLVFNVGRDAGMEVHHLHLHVLGGRRLDWPPG
jgi:histidine triad (HIT) family protein